LVTVFNQTKEWESVMGDINIKLKNQKRELEPHSPIEKEKDRDRREE